MGCCPRGQRQAAAIALRAACSGIGNKKKHTSECRARFNSAGRQTVFCILNDGMSPTSISCTSVEYCDVYGMYCIVCMCRKGAIYDSSLQLHTMIQNFGGDGLNHTAQWFESNKYGLNDTTELAVWFESRQTA